MTDELPPLSPDMLPQPLKDLVLIRSIRVGSSEVVTAGGIVLPEMSENSSSYEYGEVIAVGKGAFAGAYGTRIELDVVVGDEVVFIAKAGWKFRHEGVDYRCARELDCYMVLNYHRPNRKTGEQSE